MASCRRVSLYQREILLRPSAAAIEILFGLASELSEGARDGGDYLGSTMMTVDLERAGALVSDTCDAATVRRLAELAGHDERVKRRASSVALVAARRTAGAPLATPELDVRVRATGHHLHIDIDVEGKLAP
jgi:hypothetical protein